MEKGRRVTELTTKKEEKMLKRGAGIINTRHFGIKHVTCILFSNELLLALVKCCSL